MSKGSQPRPYNPAAFDSGWSRIFAGPAKSRVSAKPSEADHLRSTIAYMEYNHACERKKMAQVIRRLVNYANRVAERFPQAVTGRGQAARAEGGLWLAEFDRKATIPLDPAPSSP